MFNFDSEKNLRLSLPNGTFVNYKLIKKNRKTLSLMITKDGLIVKAPILMMQDKIDLFRMDPRNPFFQVWENVKTISRKSDFAIRTGIVLRFLRDTIGF